MAPRARPRVPGAVSEWVSVGKPSSPATVSYTHLDVYKRQAHADAASVLAMLDDEAEGTYAAREALTEAIIREHRASRAAVWASLLLGAFKPMLVRLRGRLVSDTVPGDELDQLVVTAFLAALTDVPLMDRLPMRLRQRTERQVFAFLRKEREQRHPGIDVEELEDLDPDALAPRRARTDEELYDLALLIQRAVQELSLIHI